jgi:hypothetical protein
VLAAHNFVLPRRMSASVRAKSSNVEWADPGVLDVSHRAMRSQRTETARVVWACRPAELASGRDVKVCAVVARRAETEARELLTFALVPQVEGVRKLAGVAFFAEAALVMLANQIVDAAAFGGRRVVSVMA